jgi:hypothetical protein
MVGNGKAPAFRRSADTEALIRFMRGKPVGEVISNAALAEIVRRPHDKSGHVVASARRALWREREFWRPIRGVGLKRLTEAEAVGVGDDAANRIKRAAKRTGRQLAVIAMDKLSDAQKATLNMAITKMGLHSKIESPKMSERLLESCVALQKRLEMKPATMLLLE